MNIQDKVDRSVTRQKMYALIDEQKSSGLTVKDFCIRHYLSQGSFYYWLKKYQSIEDTGSTESQGGFKLLQIKDEPVESGTELFAEYKGLKIYGQVTATFLKDLIS
jgi:hypothetical protein